MKFTSVKNSLTEMFRKPRPQFDWKFGGRSLEKLKGVDDNLVRVAHLALRYSPVDFGITCGLRTLEEQQALLDAGKSQTLKSRHLDGKAIDIVCYVDGKVTWDFKHYMVAAQAIALAARELDVEIRWGAAWTSLLNHKDASAAHNDYVTLRKMQGRKPFVDGPHFEIPKE